MAVNSAAKLVAKTAAYSAVQSEVATVGETVAIWALTLVGKKAVS